MKNLPILLLITGVALFLALAGCREEIPPSEPPDIEYARDISFDTLTIEQVKRFLQKQGRWKVEARYNIVSSANIMDYAPSDHDAYFEFADKDTLRIFTDSGVTAYKTDWLTASKFSVYASVYEEERKKITFYFMPGISNHRLRFDISADNGWARWYSIPEAMIPALPLPDLAQKTSLAGLPVSQVQKLLSGTKWSVAGQLLIDYVEFVGTDTLRIIGGSIIKNYEIGQWYETISDVVKGFRSSYPDYESLEDAGESYALVELSDISDKTMLITFQPGRQCSNCGYMTCRLSLVE